MGIKEWWKGRAGIDEPDSRKNQAEAVDARWKTENWESRKTTSWVFGARAAWLRQQALVSIDELAKATERSPSWIRSLERGEFLLTPEQVETLQNGFKELASGNPKIGDCHMDLLAEYRKGLDGLPPSFEVSETWAKDLRVPESLTTEPDTVEIRTRLKAADVGLPVPGVSDPLERLMTALPLYMTVVLGILLWFARRADLGTPPSWTDARIAAGLALSSLVLFVLFGEFWTVLLRWTQRIVFHVPLRGWRQDFRGLLDRDGIPMSKEYTWVQDGSARFMPPIPRALFTSVTTALELGERLFVAALGYSLLSLKLTVDSDRLSFDSEFPFLVGPDFDSWQMRFLLATSAVCASLLIFSVVFSRRAVRAVYDGVGWPRRD